MSQIRVDRIENRIGEVGVEVEKIAGLFESGHANKGAGSMPFDENLNYPEQSVGAALKLANNPSWVRTRLEKEIRDVRDSLSGRSINIWEFASSAGGYSANGDHTLWNWQPAIQIAFDYMRSGDELYFPGGYTYRVINAIGVGENLVAQRANAVATGTLKALTSSKNNLSIVIDGKIVSTSALDDVFRMTGNYVVFSGKGSIEGPGVFLDTNPSGLDEPELVQWYPSLIRLDGDNSGVVDIRFIDQVTIGAYLRGSRGYSLRADYHGGPTSHGDGTFLFGIYAGTPVGGTSGHRIFDNIFSKKSDGGASYSGIFNVSTNTTIAFNYFSGQFEHGIYNYGRHARIFQNIVEGTTIAAGIQSFAEDCDIDLNTIRDCRGGIALQNPNRCRVRGNKVYEGISLSAISVRSFVGTNISSYMSDLEISDNQVALSSDKQSVIDVLLDHAFVRLAINNNTISGAPGPGASGRLAAITVRVFDSAGNAGNDLEINDNKIFNCGGYAINIGRVQVYEVARNKIVNVNQDGTTSVAMIAYSSGNGRFDKNIVIDRRTSKLTAKMVQASTSDLNGNTYAEGNVGIGLMNLDEPLTSLPDGILGYGNTQENLSLRGIFTASNTAEMVINQSISKASAAIRPGAIVLLNPVGKLALDQQAGANRAYVKSVGNASFTIATSSGNSPGQNSIFEFEVIQ